VERERAERDQKGRERIMREREIESETDRKGRERKRRMRKGKRDK